MVVKWAACSPSTPTIWVRYTLKCTFCIIVVEKNNKIQKEAIVGPFKKTIFSSHLSDQIALTCELQKWKHSQHKFGIVHNTFDTLIQLHMLQNAKKIIYYENIYRSSTIGITWILHQNIIQLWLYNFAKW